MSANTIGCPNAVLILTHDNLELTRKCVQSIWEQDLETFIYFEDNDSKDGTAQWLYRLCDGKGSDAAFWSENRGVSFGWNDGLNWLFSRGAEHVLVVNNDAILPFWTYRRLLDYAVMFVTGVAVDFKYPREPTFDPRDLDPHPDFSCFLIRKWAWEKVGLFNTDMKLYASDCDWHIRAHRRRLSLWKSNTPYYHVNSQTLLRASPEERREIEEQANKDREVFRSIWGCLPGTPEYERLFDRHPVP